MQKKFKSTRALLTAAVLSTAASAHAAFLPSSNYVETGDAGQTLATAQNAGAFPGGASTISGTIGTSTDADLYSFTLSVATQLRFVSTSTTGIDTNIFLFNSTGVALFGNDDSSTSIQGAFTTNLLAAGTYYFGISLSGNEPVNSNNQLLFTSAQPPGSLRTAAGNVNPTTLATFNGNTAVAETGPYSVAITAVPEPSTTVTALAGVLASFGLVRRLRRQRQA